MTNSIAPEEIDLSSERLERAYDFLEECVAVDRIPGAAILVARGGVPLEPRCFGHQFLPDDASSDASNDGPLIQPDTIFLTASVTKPVTVSAVMLLAERGKLLLHQPVCDFIPEFGNRGKEAITLHHLMTHTSGLPDMLPENIDLRKQAAPLKEFVRRMMDLELDFAPGTNIQYQSCGIAILGEIVERLEGVSLPEFLRREIFEPLGMIDTGLGAEGLQQDRIAHVNVTPEMRGTEWSWNESYWWHFGAPWGGMFSTVSDMFRYCQTFLNGGRLGDQQIFSLAMAEAMVRDQTTPMTTLSPKVAYGHAWGLGWRLQPANGWSYFGDLISPGSFGHGGATGTVVWADPVRDMVCILFTTEPSANSGGLLGRCSNLVAAAAI